MNAEVQSMGMFEWFLLLLLSLLWGGSFFFVGVAVEALPPLTIVTLRVALASIALMTVVRRIGVRFPSDLRIWSAFIVMGVLNNVIPFCLIVWGQTHIASGLAAILNATAPIFAVIAAHFLTRDEQMTRLKIAGVAIGFCGVIFMIGQEALAGLGDNTLAQVAILGAALAYAFAGIYGRRFRLHGVRPLVTATGQVTVSTIILLPMAYFIDKPFTLAMPGIAVLAAITGLALVSTALAYIIYFQILATAGATNVLLVTLLIPVSAILLGAIFLDEQLGLQHYAGMGLISVGLLAIDGRIFARLPSRR